MLVLAACTTTRAPEAGKGAGEVAIPAPPTAGINDGVTGLEAVWHLRSALNVAALSCGTDYPATVSGYNSFLRQHDGVLDDAYAFEKQQTDAQRFNQHVTRVYNHFAWPPYREHLCRESVALEGEAQGMSAARLRDWAPAALARLDTVPPRAVQLASAAPAPKARTAAVAASPAKGPRAVQLGAYTGRARAEAAWRAIRDKLPSAQNLTPSYEKVPGRADLVRLRVRAPMSQAEAVALCASAAASGFDCFPVEG